MTAKRWRGYCLFLLTPLREGRLHCRGRFAALLPDFYSRPCGRGDIPELIKMYSLTQFLLTPLREGRRVFFTGLADVAEFLLTPLREGRP